MKDPATEQGLMWLGESHTCGKLDVTFQGTTASVTHKKYIEEKYVWRVRRKGINLIYF